MLADFKWSALCFGKIYLLPRNYHRYGQLYLLGTLDFASEVGGGAFTRMPPSALPRWLSSPLLDIFTMHIPDAYANEYGTLKYNTRAKANQSKNGYQTISCNDRNYYLFALY